uniref:CHCH domain-containing protein n=1 Tax=Hyaloperonospora arabidopsidis (strain Emoy2) TaxID=559515 RepID=M4BNW7_HYAAE
MGRSRSSRPAARPAPRRAPAPAQARRSAPAPAHKQAAPAPAHPSSSGGGMMSGLMSTVAQGMAFGTGSAVAHRAVSAVAGSFSGGADTPQQQPEGASTSLDHQTAQPPAQNQCGADQKAFLECLNSSSNDIASCQMYLDQFKTCQMQQPSTFM